MPEHVMAVETLFGWSGQAAMIGWLVLVLGPRRWSIVRWIPKFIIPLGLSLVYAVLMLINFFQSPGGYGSLSDVRALFSNENLLLAGWIHYLAFDLFIGAWIGERADELGISRLIQPVFFAATFMFGPLGLALFLITHALYTSKDGPS